MPSHEQWMALCQAGAGIFSKCSRRSYFSVVLSSTGRVLGTGYNGAPAGLTDCTDGGCPRATENVAHGAPYDSCVALHAEENAIIHSDRSAREGGTLYVNGPPCWQCTKMIAGSGIKTVVHTTDLAYKDWPKCLALLESVKINVISLAIDNKLWDTGSALGVGQECPVDLASSSSNRMSVASRDRWLPDVGPFASLGSDDCCDD